MLCSNCSQPLLPVVAIDIDGTLGDYHGHFLRFAQQYFNRVFLGQYDGTNDLSEYMEVNKEDYRACKLAYRQGGLKRSMPVYPGARNFLNAVRQISDVFITTTRPYLRLDQTDPDTREWLHRNGLKYDGLLYDEDKYIKLDEIVDHGRVVAVLDDLGSQYDAAAHMFGSRVPILRQNPYNTGVQRGNTVHDLDEALSQIQGRVQEWGYRVDHSSEGRHREASSCHG